MWVLVFMSSTSGVWMVRAAAPWRAAWRARSLYIGRWFAFCSPPRHACSSHNPPRSRRSNRVLSPLPGNEGIHAPRRDAPVAAVQLVGALEAAALAPPADGRRGAVEASGQLGDREVRAPERLVGVVVLCREAEQPLPGEGQ